LNGILAVVTGGASGLRVPTVRELAAAGAHIAIRDRNGAAAREIAAQIGGLGLEVDVVSEQSVTQALVESMVSSPDLRVLVNFAGIGGASLVAGPKGTHSPHLSRSIIYVNLIGSFNTFRKHALDWVEKPSDYGTVMIFRLIVCAGMLWGSWVRSDEKAEWPTDGVKECER
jgi:NAD(P)-dependent dehydrogenase (short-subunit alcohol dehydrogenase family)